MYELMNNRGVCRTALATPGLLINNYNTLNFANINTKTKNPAYRISRPHADRSTNTGSGFLGRTRVGREGGCNKKK